MEDGKIVDLFWERKQQAIVETEKKYKPYCHTIAWNILYNREDCEECMNDTWMRAWNAMPSERPNILSAFLGAITRNLSLDLYRKKHSKKRGEGEIIFVLDELSDCITNDGPEQHLDKMETARLLNLFLEQLEQEQRMIFVRRYWYMDSVSDIGKRFGISESKVKSSLFRSRNKLRTYLMEEGVDL